jgi:hypothetical protein
MESGLLSLSNSTRSEYLQYVWKIFTPAKGQYVQCIVSSSSNRNGDQESKDCNNAIGKEKFKGTFDVGR